LYFVKSLEVLRMLSDLSPSHLFLSLICVLISSSQNLIPRAALSKAWLLSSSSFWLSMLV
jgi:hypothetical protein